MVDYDIQATYEPAIGHPEDSGAWRSSVETGATILALRRGRQTVSRGLSWTDCPLRNDG
jgi:hypothetical protein